MKGYRVVLAAIVMVALSACTFDAPLVAEPSLPIDKALVGSWQLVPEADDPDATPERIVVKQSSANEYVIEHIADDSVIYFSGCLAELHGIRFVQLEVTGDDEGPVAAGDTDLFSVFSFELTGNDLFAASETRRSARITRGQRGEVRAGRALEQAQPEFRNDGADMVENVSLDGLGTPPVGVVVETSGLDRQAARAGFKKHRQNPPGHTRAWP
jgi:hypothetical protein